MCAVEFSLEQKPPTYFKHFLPRNLSAVDRVSTVHLLRLIQGEKRTRELIRKKRISRSYIQQSKPESAPTPVEEKHKANLSPFILPRHHQLMSQGSAAAAGAPAAAAAKVSLIPLESTAGARLSAEDDKIFEKADSGIALSGTDIHDGNGVQSPREELEPPTFIYTQEEDDKRDGPGLTCDSCGKDGCACNKCLHADLREAMKQLELSASDYLGDDNELKPKLKKSSSLRGSKTPPGEHQKRKMVRFADAFGFDLEAVKHVFNLDVPPVIPKSAVADLDLQSDTEEAVAAKAGGSFRALSSVMTGGESQPFDAEGNIGASVTELVPNFGQPGASMDFLTRVWNDKVSLESVSTHQMTVTGTVRVCNICFEKIVFVRYTVNNWMSHVDVAAHYVPNSSDGATDKFSFAIFVPSHLPLGYLLFAVCFRTNCSIEYWDNNYSMNYCLNSISRPLFHVSAETLY